MLNFINEITTRFGVNCGTLDVTDIAFNDQLRKYCEMNSCGNYGKNYMCPPLVGDTADNINKVKLYKTAIVIQKVFKIEDSYDFEGMMEGQDLYKEAFKQIIEMAAESFDDYFILGVGGCQLCEKCAAIQNAPCPHPDKAHASLESYCIDVSQIATACGLKYINGENTVTYFGAVFIK